MPTPPVAVIDIGSNSIKILIATRAADGSVQPLKVRTLDARISAGLSQASPNLSKAGIQRGVAAVVDLLADADAAGAGRIALVATSAVRDAGNGREFQARVRAATGHDIRILSGDDEASLIGRGLVTDPALLHLRDFYVFDLGGGSLECLAFRDRHMEQATSLRLGCVRLTERFVADPERPLAAESIAAIAAHTREVLAASGFRLDLPAGAIAVGTGGTVSTVRAILGAPAGLAFDATPAVVTVAQLRELLARLAPLPLAERRLVPGLPPARADVFPSALVTLLAVADAGRFGSFQNSLRNLRYGIADTLLAE